ncbi:MAG: hypothetical protein RSB10_03400 [Clostridia bacterium]
MSFSCDCKSDRVPGQIKSNPLNGICEKACIQCDKVLDMCMRQEVISDSVITLTNITPSGLVAPYTFLSAKSCSSQGVIKDLSVNPVSSDSCLARITCVVDAPLQVVITDCNGKQGVGTAVLHIPKDIVMNVSAPSVIPYRIDATVNVACPQGTYAGSDAKFVVTACVTTILKVLIQVQLLVPSYGYCYIPQCQEYNSQTCDNLFDLPLYPQDCSCEPRCNSAPNCAAPTNCKC